MAKRISKAIDTSVSQTHQHETLEDNNSISHQEPPPYSSPVAARPSPSGNQQRSIRCLSNIPSLPNLDYSKYQIPECTVSKDGTITTNYRPLCSDATALAQFIREQAALPPLPYIRIVGLPPGASQPDFDVRINMLRYFLPTRSSTGWNYLKLVEDGQLAFRGKNTQTTTPNTKNGIEDWAKRFCAEKSSLKTFTLERHITNWDTSYIEGQIRSLVAATGYTNHVTVTFPVRYSKITVQPRGEGFIATLFSPILEKKRYEVARAVWPYATLPPGIDAEDTGRSCAVQTEEAWWREWKDVLNLAIVTRRNGWVSLDDMLEFQMRPTEPQIPKNPWGYQ
ncbi:hypothetical protein DTO027B5_107 [Paecilomyces variotii]|nr:hypothetical protein DTO217A2_3482 [Paecilomyces variotii]KAJ9322409.1 hypothetical protein DTO027B3_6541 [Paecilomyces variotii]KAJ9337955.1 hypothetical protein DTO027B5_107 [Paecilomyces variotii]KAJ9371015.1 hypothetical protein DTO282E5_4312 [Paecilomyces variotii]KAJ9399229.1 hypothetical protein DTO282F9_3852 [Paecilomyces variotii]